MAEGSAAPPHGVDLLWIPLGAGAHVVRLSGRAFERCAAALARRPPAALFHSALVVSAPSGRFVVEMTPVPRGPASARGVVGTGAVGLRVLGRLRLFRYEIRRWRDGVIPDADAAVGGPVRVLDGSEAAERLLALVPLVPTPVWGGHQLAAGDMWNSNSVVAWILARCDAPVESLRPPGGGRAPGWRAGLEVAGRG